MAFLNCDLLYINTLCINVKTWYRKRMSNILLICFLLIRCWNDNFIFAGLKKVWYYTTCLVLLFKNATTRKLLNYIFLLDHTSISLSYGIVRNVNALLFQK